MRIDQSHLPLHPDFGLPIYPEETPLVELSQFDLNQSNLQKLARSTDTFVRTVKDGCMGIKHHSENLVGKLEEFDEEFHGIAKLCGARVVPHAWGVKYSFCDGSFMFTDWKLVAEVASIQEALPVKRNLTDGILRCIERYEKAAQEDDRSTYAGDIVPEQFVYGRLPWAKSKGLWLVDIDPWDGRLG